MSEKLLESDFLTVNLSSVFKRQKATDTADSDSSDTQQPTNEVASDASQINDWGAELEKRLTDNSKMSAEARKTEAEIEATFFEEYFKSHWDEDVAKQLMLMGEPLKKALRVLGFEKASNPILAFISDDYVIDNLIKTKLLNTVTFKAIYNSVAKKLVADKEFLKANDYNIIYCRDLYKKPLDEIMRYLALQNESLDVNFSSYSAVTRANNQKTFIFIKTITTQGNTERAQEIKDLVNTDISVRADDAQLNDLALAETIYQVLNTVEKLDAGALQGLARKLKTPSMKLAALQYLNITSNSDEVKKALSKEVFRSLSAKDIIAATQVVAQFMPKVKISADDVSTLVGLILNDLGN